MSRIADPGLVEHASYKMAKTIASPDYNKRTDLAHDPAASHAMQARAVVVQAQEGMRRHAQTQGDRYDAVRDDDDLDSQTTLEYN